MASSFESEEFEALKTPSVTVLSFEDARQNVKNRIATFHRLLGKREEEILAEIDRAESLNLSKLETIELDIRKLELTLEQVELNLKSNNLVEFQTKQSQEIRDLMAQYGTKKYSLDKVCLNWEIDDTCFNELGKVTIFRTKKYERDTIAPLLKLEPMEGETNYVVSHTWFQKWKQAVNFDSSDIKCDNEIMSNIPINNLDILGKDLHTVSPIYLHSEAWDQLLYWHGMSEGSYPISFTNQIVPLPRSNTFSESKLRFSYRIITETKWGSVKYLYLTPTDTYQDVFTVATQGISNEKQEMKMYARIINMTAKKILSKMVFGTVPLSESDLITEYSDVIGTNTNLRFYFLVPV
ncbi:Ubiquitin carboxyl-terminal hydrolase 15-like [Oopsacas minuta]|uniref:Ubiquitin carboxyl-terminal hydrolase 15-like n=1 Tax=Oopsacas minuta TaxID=111878 RepID=A0AAV7JKD4_9METZ|nr:Ubiquitin carboxyl-terminal hydrolase 15-like [Oopsacas minuta]